VDDAESFSATRADRRGLDLGARPDLDGGQLGERDHASTRWLLRSANVSPAAGGGRRRLRRRALAGLWRGLGRGLGLSCWRLRCGARGALAAGRGRGRRRGAGGPRRSLTARGSARGRGRRERRPGRLAGPERPHLLGENRNLARRSAATSSAADNRSASVSTSRARPFLECVV
jgi:hypothetical protein